MNHLNFASDLTQYDFDKALVDAQNDTQEDPDFSIGATVAPKIYNSVVKYEPAFDDDDLLVAFFSGFSMGAKLVLNQKEGIV